MRKEYDFTRLKRAEPKYLRRLKGSVTMRLDSDVIDYFRALAVEIGMPYQSLINYVLGEYASRQLQPSANWDAQPRRTQRAGARPLGRSSDAVVGAVKQSARRRPGQISGERARGTR